MIQSMTGYGAAEHAADGVSYALEIRGVNGRYLKLSIKLPELLQFAESAVDKLLKSRLARGSVTCILRVRSEGVAGAGTINVPALQHYLDQLSKVQLPAGVQAAVDLGTLAALPGVCQPPEVDEEAQQQQLEIIEDLASRALDAVIEMRRSEGQALRGDILDCCAAVRKELAEVTSRAPTVVDEYHERLRSRVEMLMQAGGFELEADGLMRDVAVFAERCDISEELTRLNAHLEQFAELCDREEAVGRTLDFLTQELLREANTIASKSNDAAIARSVVVIKGLIDRLKEQVQNVE
jgi:uncharacterized protein (TIGR00255 family)